MNNRALAVSDHWSAEQQSMIDDIVEGLSQPQKSLPSKYFYDEAGSRLFDEITELPEYYPTRTEATIMTSNAASIASALGEGVLLVEYGSGSSVKTRVLLDNLSNMAAYVPVDISGDYLLNVAADLRTSYPEINVLPVVADFTQPFDLPDRSSSESRIITYFPGSTIGNFTRDDARRILKQMTAVAGPGGGVLIGVDLLKGRQTLRAAYNDSAGVTAQFNLNMLRRFNCEIGTDFQLNRFRHEAIFNEEESRIEMHLYSLDGQSVCVDDQLFRFEPGESILTEYSHKYAPDSFARLAGEAGLKTRQVWTDANSLFSVQYLEPA